MTFIEAIYRRLANDHSLDRDNVSGIVEDVAEAIADPTGTAYTSEDVEEAVQTVLDYLEDEYGFASDPCGSGDPEAQPGMSARDWNEFVRQLRDAYHAYLEGNPHDLRELVELTLDAQRPEAA